MNRIETACAAGVLGLWWAAPAPAADAEAYWHFSGAFHPAAAHFPIALLVVAGVVEGWRAMRGKKVPGDAGYTCLMLGTLGAVVAAVLGWANAAHAGEFNGTQADVLFIHRWLGVAVAVVSVIMSVVATKVRGGGELSLAKRFGVLVGLLLCAGLVGLTGSYGGKLTFGVDYYETVYNETIGAAGGGDTAEAQKVAGVAKVEDGGEKVQKSGPGESGAAPTVVEATTKAVDSGAAPAAADRPSTQQSAGADNAGSSAALPTGASTTAPADPAATIARVSYAAHIKPIFALHCFKCHGEGKQKGDYRMDAQQYALEPGDSGEAPIVPGKAEESLLVKVIEGKGKYKDSMMPPKGTILTAQQVALVRRWIDEGARWEE